MADTQKTYTDVEKEIAALILELGPERALARLKVEEPKMIKVVVNTGHCDFTLNRMAESLLESETGFNKRLLIDMNDPELRTDPIFVKFIETHGDLAGDRGTEIKFVEVPSDAKWYIMGHGRGEYIREKARTWD